MLQGEKVRFFLAVPRWRREEAKVVVSSLKAGTFGPEVRKKFNLLLEKNNFNGTGKPRGSFHRRSRSISLVKSQVMRDVTELVSMIENYYL